MLHPHFSETLFSSDRIVRERPTGLSGVFSSDSSLVVSVPVPPRIGDYDRFVVELENLTGTPLLAGLRLTHRSGEPSAVSFSGGREEVDETGPTTLLFPIESFGSYGKPDGWNDVRTIELLFVREKTSTITDPITVSIRDLLVQTRRLPEGPRLSEEGLVSISTRTPEVTNGTRTFTPYDPTHSLIRVPAPSFYECDTAEAILSGRVMGQDTGYPFDWKIDPDGLLEWRHFLHRHHFFRPLVRALAQDGKRIHADALTERITTWITTNPVPVGSNGGASPAWETLSVAFRLREWLWAASVLWDHPSLGPSGQRLILRSLWEHARHLMDHRGHPNNWRLIEAASLALVGLLFPEFLEADGWSREGLTRLVREMDQQFLPDGVHFEISPLYHALCVQACLEVLLVLKTSGQRFTGLSSKRVLGLFSYLAALHRPDFSWPAINDSSGATGEYRELMRAAGEEFERPDLVWIGSGGRLGRAPKRMQHDFPHAGIRIDRSGYDRDALWCLFRAGPAGAAHVHQDVLSIELTALGRPWLVDPGVSGYAPGPLTTYYRSARAHTMVVVDGTGPERERLPFAERVRASPERGCRQTGRLRWMVGVCEGPWIGSSSRVRVERAVCLVDGRFVVVRDTLTDRDGRDIHDLSIFWQFFPCTVQIAPGSTVVRARDRQSRNLTLMPALEGKACTVVVREGHTDPITGFVSIEGRDVPAPNVTYTLRTVLPRVLLWVLYPHGDDERTPIELDRIDQGLSCSLTLTFRDNTHDTIEVGE